VTGADPDPRWPVSVKGVLGWHRRYVVLRNERGEWELPGGRPDDADPDPATTLRREIREELGIDVTVGPIVDSWFYNIGGNRVIVITYRCHGPRPPKLTHSHEHSEVAVLGLDELRSSSMPDGYLNSLQMVDQGD